VEELHDFPTYQQCASNARIRKERDGRVNRAGEVQRNGVATADIDQLCTANNTPHLPSRLRAAR